MKFPQLSGSASVLLALTLVPLVFDMGCAEPVQTPKLALLLLATGLSALPWGGNEVRPLARPASLCLSLWLGWAWLSALYHGMEPAWEWLVPVTASWIWLRSGLGRHPWAERALLAGWVLTASYSWLQRLGLDPAPWSHPELSRLRTIAGLGNPNYLAMYLGALLPLAWARSFRLGPLAWVGCWLGWLALLLTSTRGASLAVTGVALLGALLWYAGRRISQPKLWLIGLVLLISGWPVAWWLSLHTFQHRTSLAAQFSPGKEGRIGAESIQTRLLLWQSASRDGCEHPFLGIGPGRFGQAYLRRRPLEPEGLRPLQRLPEDPHSEPLRVWSETGAVGWTLWALWLGFTLRGLLRQPSAHTLGFAILAVNGLSNGWPLAVWPVLMVWTQRAAPVEGEPARHTPLRAGLALGFLTLCVCLATMVMTVQHLFWWDDEYRLTLDIRKQDDQVRRFSSLLLAEKIAPPWLQGEVLRRQSGFFAESPGPQAGPRAEEYALRVLQRDLQSPYAWIGWAVALQKEGKLAQAERAWEQAHRLDPRNPITLQGWAGCLYLSGDSLAAERKLKESLEIYSKNPQVYQFLAQIMIDRGETWEGYWGWVRGLQAR